MRPGSAVVAAGAVLLAARPAAACEPVVPVMMVLAGPAFLMAAGMGLLVAVGVKCAAYAAFERRFPWHRSVGLMFLANVVSTLVGIVVAVLVGVPALGILGLVVIYFLARVPAERFCRECDWRPLSGWGPRAVAGAVVGLVAATVALFIMADAAQWHGDVAGYWALKVLYVMAAVTVSMAVTTFWEGGVIARLAGVPPRPGGSGRLTRRRGRLVLGAGGENDRADDTARHAGGIFRNVFRANLVTFAVVAAIAAAMMLPERMQHPGWLVPVFMAWILG